MQNSFGSLPNHFQCHEKILSKNSGAIFIFENFPSTILSLVENPPPSNIKQKSPKIHPPKS
eukprot:UN13437